MNEIHIFKPDFPVWVLRVADEAGKTTDFIWQRPKHVSQTATLMVYANKDEAEAAARQLKESAPEAAGKRITPKELVELDANEFRFRLKAHRQHGIRFYTMASNPNFDNDIDDYLA